MASVKVATLTDATRYAKALRSASEVRFVFWMLFESTLFKSDAVEILARRLAQFKIATNARVQSTRPVVGTRRLKEKEGRRRRVVAVACARGGALLRMALRRFCQLLRRRARWVDRQVSRTIAIVDVERQRPHHSAIDLEIEIIMITSPPPRIVMITRGRRPAASS